MGTVTDTRRLYATLDRVKEQFKANEYSLINQNCNHFTDAFCVELLGKNIPSYITRL